MADEKRTERDVLIPEGPDHGYWGRAVDENERDVYTVAGHTGGTTANVADTPKRSKPTGRASEPRSQSSQRRRSSAEDSEEDSS